MNPHSFPIYRLRVTYTVSRRLQFSPFSGTSIYGILGRALMKVNPRAYEHVFRVEAPRSYEHYKKTPILPSPFVLKVVQEPKEMFEKGDLYVFDLVLIGQSIHYLHDVMDSLVEIENMEVGNKSKQARGEMKLSCIEFYESADRVLPLFSTSQVCLFRIPETVGKNSERLQLNFLSPVNLGKSELPKKLAFDLVTKRMLGRLELLSLFYAPDFSFEQTAVSFLEQSALQIEHLESKFESQNVVHSRIKPYYAHIGQASFQGNFEPFLPLLHLFEQLHIGSNTSAGLGEFELQLL